MKFIYNQTSILILYFARKVVLDYKHISKHILAQAIYSSAGMAKVSL